MGEIRIIHGMDVGSLVRAANSLGITKDQFITVVKEDDVYILLYYYESGRED